MLHGMTTAIKKEQKLTLVGSGYLRPRATGPNLLASASSVHSQTVMSACMYVQPAFTCKAKALHDADVAELPFLRQLLTPLNLILSWLCPIHCPA